MSPAYEDDFDPMADFENFVFTEDEFDEVIAPEEQQVQEEQEYQQYGQQLRERSAKFKSPDNTGVDPKAIFEARRYKSANGERELTDNDILTIVMDQNPEMATSIRERLDKGENASAILNRLGKAKGTGKSIEQSGQEIPRGLQQAGAATFAGVAGIPGVARSIVEMGVQGMPEAKESSFGISPETLNKAQGFINMLDPIYWAKQGASMLPDAITAPVKRAYEGFAGLTPTPQEILEAGEMVNPELYAQDSGERIARTAGEFVGTGAPFGAGAIIPSALSGVTYQGAEEQGAPEWFKTIASLAGGAGGVVAQEGAKIAARGVPQQLNPVFRQPITRIERAATKAFVNEKPQELNRIISRTSEEAISDFDRRIGAISQQQITDLGAMNAEASVSAERQALKEATLNRITPTDYGNNANNLRAVQQNANEMFQENVIRQEARAYDAARDLAAQTRGEITGLQEPLVQMMLELEQLPPGTMTADQQATYRFVQEVLQTLNETVAEQRIPASQILGPDGMPIVPETIRPGGTRPATLNGQQLVELIQRGNKFIQYDAQGRLYQHRLKGIWDALKAETQQILGQNSQAANLLEQANNLHANNARTWGTDFMNRVRYSQTPEDLVNGLRKATNLENLRNAIGETDHYYLAEKTLFNDLENAGLETFRKEYNELRPALSERSRYVGRGIAADKDPLSGSGRVATRNSILLEAVQVLDGIKNAPDQALKLMQTDRGYNVVRNALSGTQQGRELFRVYERLFLENLMGNLTDDGILNFKKVREVLRNPETINVIRRIGGEELVNRFGQLETMSNNFRNNMLNFSQFEQGALNNFIREARQGITLAFLSKQLLGATLGGAKFVLGGKLLSMAANRVMVPLLKNPRTFELIRRMTQAKTYEAMLPILIQLDREIEKVVDDDTLRIINQEAANGEI